MSIPKRKNKITTPSPAVPSLLKKGRTSCRPPMVLTILDGWGINKPYPGNAIELAKKPNYDFLWQNFLHTELQASGHYVGLPAKQDGNSEAGHLNLGAGRIIEQDSIIINKAIKSGLFFKNPAFLRTVEHVKKHNSAIHLMGLLTGEQSAHADPKHLLALLKFFREHKIKNIYLHLFTDGRDSFKYGALKFLTQLKKELKPNEKIATLMGRYYAMDRTKNWARTAQAYQALVTGKTKYYARSADEAIKFAYDRGETDEFVAPTLIITKSGCDKKRVCVSGKPVGLIKEKDSVVFFNLRSDRSRQLIKAFSQKDFNKKNSNFFKKVKTLKDLVFVAMTEAGPDLENVLPAFPSINIKKTLPFVLKDLKQFYLAETEKFAHVTYFFNGGYADPVNGEERLIIPSPDVASYDIKPEMSAFKICDMLIDALHKNKYEFTVVNFANPDMVGHTGNLAAGVKAIEAVDKCLGKILKVIKDKQGILLVVADHGNAEEMIDMKTGETDTQHSSFPVPFILADWRFNKKKKYALKNNGALCDVAPTILKLLAIKKPREMSGESLII